MANIRVTCPACKSELELDATFEGQEVECGNCLEVFKATRPGAADAPGSSGTGKIPGAGTGSSAGGRGRSSGRPAPRKRRRDEDDDDYGGRGRDDDYDDDDYGPPPPRRAGGEGDGAATASLVLGILAVFPGCCCGILSAPLAISAIVTGIIGLKSQNNKVMAILGLVFGIVAIGIIALRLILGFGMMLNNPQQFR